MQNDKNQRWGAVISAIFLYAALYLFALVIQDQHHFLANGLFIALFGNLVIGIFMLCLHGYFQTGRYVEDTTYNINWGDFSLKVITGLFETLLYSFGVATGLQTLVAGALVVKSVGNIWASKNPGKETELTSLPAEKNLSNKESRIVAVYRLGFALQLILVLLCTYPLIKSPWIENVRNLHQIHENGNG